MSFASKLLLAAVTTVLAGLSVGFCVGKFGLNNFSNQVVIESDSQQTGVPKASAASDTLANPPANILLTGIGGESQQVRLDQSTVANTLKSYYGALFARNFADVYAIWVAQQRTVNGNSFKLALQQLVTSNKMFNDHDDYQLELVDTQQKLSGLTQATVALKINGKTTINEVTLDFKAGKYYIADINAKTVNNTGTSQ